MEIVKWSLRFQHLNIWLESLGISFRSNLTHVADSGHTGGRKAIDSRTMVFLDWLGMD